MGERRFGLVLELTGQANNCPISPTCGNAPLCATGHAAVARCVGRQVVVTHGDSEIAGAIVYAGDVVGSKFGRRRVEQGQTQFEVKGAGICEQGLCSHLRNQSLQENPNHQPDLLPSPRIFSTHISYSSLAKSIIDSNCQIVYICRNPKDVLVSSWHFGNKIQAKLNKDQSLLSLEEAFQLFCKGGSPFGPFWEHVLGFWKASLERPERILFLKYEDLRSNPLIYLRKLAQHLRYPFSLEEEKQGVVEKILNLCSFQNLSNLEVNKNPDKVSHVGVEYSAFFRKGQVEDWKNHLTADMIEHIDRISEQKFHGYDLSF
ncbi:PREDICTED: cytosolic sulfotransferase 7-like [Nelumbo nucifera]|uniref:Sulfotransferase n=1 Tax=Nelumbo nucifera TaxID=4432 RepID=A0A1U8B8V7_NELNU|nr:PREDICTED: cytosolic sulfotransferase 7-like [Nelumbo nucifera]